LICVNCMRVTLRKQAKTHTGYPGGLVIFQLKINHLHRVFRFRSPLLYPTELQAHVGGARARRSAPRVGQFHRRLPEPSSSPASPRCPEFGPDTHLRERRPAKAPFESGSSSARAQATLLPSGAGEHFSWTLHSRFRPFLSMIFQDWGRSRLIRRVPDL